MRSYDVVLFGATGFTGKLVAEYLAGAKRPIRWAIAGRNRGKLEAVRRDLAAIDPKLADLPIEIADGLDRASLDALVPKARVVCTTVGPYAKYGEGLVAACASHGAHYCDLTGEVQFIRRSIDANHEVARRTRARIVHCCGFDSIPSDLGVHMLWDCANRRGQKLAWAKGFAGESKGGFSGGTIASMMNIMEEATRDRAVRRILGNPYALDPDPSRGGPPAPDQRGVRFDRDLGRWTAPFVMAAINTRVVRRSNALLDHAYGPSFRYDEAMSFMPGPKGLAMATAVTAGLAGFVSFASVGPLRRWMEKRVLPKPGEGPSKAERDRGYFVFRHIAQTEDGARLEGRVEGRSDPGYGETAKMLGESALCLAEDEAALPERFGVLTPAASMGMHLVERLRRAGMTFRVED
jgi:short subunit dehydrogenase-like uncharacterized protein